MTALFQAFFEQARLHQPRLALVLGSGLGDLAERIATLASVPFVQIPGLDEPTVAGHNGSMMLGTWAGKCILLFSGRLHFYEGHSWRRVLGPVHIAREMGVESLLLTNAAGGIRDDLTAGSLMLLEDHIEWNIPNCWRLAGPGGIGPSRPSPYSVEVRNLLHQAAQAVAVSLPAGIYAQVTGPCYETPAEVRALKSLGADAVGMSTARETQVACELGLRCAAISVITNRAAGLGPGKIHHDEVLANAAYPCERLADVLQRFLQMT